MKWEKCPVEVDYTGKVVVLTGAAGGIGSRIAMLFAQNGASMLLVDKNEEMLRITREACGGTGKIVCMSTDLGEKGFSQKIVQKCKEEFGTAHVLIHCAAVADGGSLCGLSEEDWDSTMKIDLKVPFLLSKEFANEIMIPAGCGVILNMASQAGIVALDDQPAYCVAKAGLIALTRSQAYEWGQFGIRAVAIAPTVIETAPALTYWCGERAARHISQIPVGRFGRPDEVAAACLFLASDAAGMISGTTVMLDGGYTIR